MDLDFGHIVLLAVSAFGIWWLKTHPLRPADKNLRTFLWVLAIAALVIAVASMFGLVGDVAVDRPILP